MAVFSLYPSNSLLYTLFPNHSLSYFETFRVHLQNELNSTARTRTRSSSRFAVSSSHSNPKILKSNRRSRFGQRLSPYDSDNENESIDDEEDEDDDDDEDWLFDDLGPGYDNDDKLKRKAQAASNGNRGSMYSRTGRKQKIINGNGRVVLDKNNYKEYDKDRGPGYNDDDDDDKFRRKAQASSNSNGGGIMYSGTGRRQNIINGNGKVMLDRNYTKNDKKEEAGKSSKNRHRRLLEEIDVDEKSFPLLDYLATFGLKDSHFIQMYGRHMPSLQINVNAAKERLEFLMSVGVKNKDVKKILMRQPQILQYTVESNLKSHVAFLISLGIQDSRIGQIITATPSIFSYSVENSLKPTVRYLIEEVGIEKSDLSKVVQLSPQILVQRIDNSWNARYRFLSKELGAPRDSIVKMVTKHPQLLHYSIEHGLLPRINFLRSIGMHNSDILKVSTSLTQVFSLSLEKNLKPKYLYLVNELKNEVKSLTKYPTYLSLSLDQRIRPRHRFLVALKKAPKGPFPLSSFVPTDETFCQQWAGTSLDKYIAFRQRLLLKDLAKKYERF